MKVGTDAVILGAWTRVDGVLRILDIGTGTGLLSLMLAQRSELIRVDAIELDHIAAQQARENVSVSVFSHQITVLNRDFREYCQEPHLLYDLIICNPPYFVDSIRPDNRQRALARHSDLLSLKDIFQGSLNLLAVHGILSIIIPFERFENTVELAQNSGLYPTRTLSVYPFPGVPPKRICLEFSLNVSEPCEEKIIIEEGGRHRYSDQYKKLTKDFYLGF
jgi:tRNA1Val (adenine37-N6)-methyltransferase